MAKVIIDTQLNDFPLPIHIEKDCHYYVTLENVLNNYLKHVHTINNLSKATCHVVGANIQIIKMIIQQYLNGNISVAKTLIQSILERYLDEPFFVSEFDKSYAFRGLAPLKQQQKKFGYNVEYKERYQKMNEIPISLFRARKSDKKLSSIDMLHIPYDMREKVSTQRYSMPGIPCFYFSTTTLGVYLELGKVSFDSLYLSSYKVKSDKMKLLNLCIFQDTINGASSGYLEDYEVTHVCNLLEIFPLIIASSFVVNNNSERSFKTEYLIPQLIMMAINEMGIEAIAYLSVHMKTPYSYPHCVNIAMLMKTNLTDSRYSESLKYFKLTDPIKFENALSLRSVNLERSYINQIYSSGEINSEIMINDEEQPYPGTDFSQVDDILVSRHHFNCTYKT